MLLVSSFRNRTRESVLVFRRGLAHCGVLLIRSHGRVMVGAFCVLTRDSLRIRRFEI
jgi:hypothetical protein